MDKKETYRKYQIILEHDQNLPQEQHSLNDLRDQRECECISRNLRWISTSDLENDIVHRDQPRTSKLLSR